MHECTAPAPKFSLTIAQDMGAAGWPDQLRSGVGTDMGEPERQTRAERLAAEIADAIVTGEFAPGLRLDEQSIAGRFGVSRTPVREALRQLAATGLIETQPRRGATVARITAQQLDEMFVAMAEIEATCARLAALSMTPIERRRLEALHGRMSALAHEGQQTAYADANDTFHAALYAGAHNSVMADIALNLRRRLLPFRRAQFRAPGRLAFSHAEHDAVVKAVLRSDAVGAHAAMLHHVGLVEDAFETLAARGADKTILL